MFLDRKILRTDYGVSYGSSTLKSLQNDNVPELDLLVREAIQNSSDASLMEDGQSYSVNFCYGKFVPKQFNSILSGLEEVLDARFSDTEADYLEIRDTKTSGLTGCIRKAEIKKNDHGNFFKLIYDTGKRQTITHAGGNWGYGKSVYYRVGVGIVIFYSRIKKAEGGYENRLIITLVEDEGKVDKNGKDTTLLNSIEPVSAGKAWWGLKEGDDILPLTDNVFIDHVLDIFGIKPFKDSETGTSIIIPYLKTSELLNSIIPIEAGMRDDVRENFLNNWTSSIPSYLRLAIQRWYAPKIHNRNLPAFCKNKWLLVSVNNDPIRKQDMLPFFRLAQELYTTALAKTYNTNYESKEFKGIITLPVRIQSYFEEGMDSGFVALVNISKSELNGAENVLSPYMYIGKFEAEGGLNEPIVLFARDPGMIIDYSISGDWVKNISPPESQEDYLFAFYVPITSKIIKRSLGVPEYAGKTLGEYLRDCEASDHMAWTDRVKMQIVQRIQKNTVNAIIGQIKKSSILNVDASASKLSSRLGKNLLPRIGYGKPKAVGGSGGSGGPGGGGGARGNGLDFRIVSQKIKGNDVEIDFALTLMHGKKHALISLLIASEAGWIDAKSWMEDIGTEFPVFIQSCLINEVVTGIEGGPFVIKRICDSENDLIETEKLSFELLSEIEMQSKTQISFSSPLMNPEILGKLKIHASDKKYQYWFRFE